MKPCDWPSGNQYLQLSLGIIIYAHSNQTQTCYFTHFLLALSINVGFTIIETFFKMISHNNLSRRIIKISSRNTFRGFRVLFEYTKKSVTLIKEMNKKQIDVDITWCPQHTEGWFVLWHYVSFLKQYTCAIILFGFAFISITATLCLRNLNQWVQ